MSTGSELLSRLRLQQQNNRRHQVKKYQQRSGTTAIEESSDVNVDASDDVDTSTKIDSKPSISGTTQTTIEVCLGPDCSGAGGGAALLEIEELVSSYSRSSTTKNENTTKHHDVTILPGGCRDYCTVGPNVLVKSPTGEQQYSKVDGPDACRNIVSTIYAQVKEADTKSLSHIDAIMKRREDGIRWKCHKTKAAKERRLKMRERTVVNTD